jgi:ribosome-associated translation inhibitor RaiA
VPDDIAVQITEIGRHVHSTHEMVQHLHKRADKADERFEQLHKDHVALSSRVDAVSNHVTLVERLGEARQETNERTHSAMSELLHRVEVKLDKHLSRFDRHAESEESDRGKLFTGIILTLVSVLAGLATLLYHQLSRGGA